VSYFGDRQTKRLESKGVKTERGECAACGHDWWDHSMHECCKRGCKCEQFKPNGEGRDEAEEDDN